MECSRLTRDGAVRSPQQVQTTKHLPERVQRAFVGTGTDTIDVLSDKDSSTIQDRDRGSRGTSFGGKVLVLKKVQDGGVTLDTKGLGSSIEGFFNRLVRYLR